MAGTEKCAVQVSMCTGTWQPQSRFSSALTEWHFRVLWSSGQIQYERWKLLAFALRNSGVLISPSIGTPTHGDGISSLPCSEPALRGSRIYQAYKRRWPHKILPQELESNPKYCQKEAESPKGTGWQQWVRIIMTQFKTVCRC